MADGVGWIGGVVTVLDAEPARAEPNEAQAMAARAMDVGTVVVFMV